MAEIVATYGVHAGTTVQLDLEDVSDPDLVALYLIEDAAELVDLALCNQCANTVVDPEAVGLTGFTVGGISYGRDETGHWVPSEGGEPRG